MQIDHVGWQLLGIAAVFFAVVGLCLRTARP